MNKTSLVILLGLGAFLLSLPYMPRFFIQVRGDNVDMVCNAWMKAEKSWNNDRYIGASGETLQALWMTVDFEVRTIISRPFYQQALALEKQGQLKDAIDLCWRGAEIIGEYDMEGESAYYCNELGMQYRKSLPGDSSISPTVEP